MHSSPDMTPGNAKERRLAEEHEELRKLFDQVQRIKREWELSMDCTDDMILMVDGAGGIKRCNRTMKEFAGMEYRDIIGKNWREVLKSAGLDESGMINGSVRQCVTLLHGSTQRWFLLNKYPYDDVRLGVSGEVVTIHHVTEMKKVTDALEQTNRQLEENRSKLQYALDQVSVLLDRVITKRDLSVRFENPNIRSCSEIMQCRKEECPCYGAAAVRCWQIAGTYCDDGRQGPFLRKYGACAECPTFRQATADPVYFIGEAFNNMMHVLEQQHRELAKAYSDLQAAQSTIIQQEKMASVGQLAAGVAHEINNPTGFIMSNLGSLDKYLDRVAQFLQVQDGALSGRTGAAEVAERRKALKIDFIVDDAHSLIRESLDGAERIRKIVQDLKGFSRVDEVVVKPADINAGIESTINIVWNELKYKATVKKEYGVLPPVVCNQGQLNQVFMNILVNAAHAIEKQGEIRIRTWVEDGSVAISISDTGCGIPPDKVRRIFEPFYTTKPVGTGTGLGLSIAYDIVKKHNGSIDVESAVGTGTTFTVRIPIAAREPREAPSHE